MVFCISKPLPEAEAGIVERNNFLSIMLSLAEKPKSYIILNIGENKISLMMRGIVLREWKIDEIRVTGEPVPVKPFPVVSKDIQIDQLRLNVNIDDASEDDTITTNSTNNNASDNKTSDKKDSKYKVPAMELDDMPANYRIYFDEGISINVSSHAESFIETVKNSLISLKWRAYYPILAIWSSHKKDTFTKIDIFFKDKTEAQALFWVLTDGTECLFLPPGSKHKEDYKLLETDITVDNKEKSTLKEGDKPKKDKDVH
jgi:hypothetical protein